MSAGNFFPPAVVAEKGTEFFLGDYKDNIRKSVAHLMFEPENTLIAHEATVKGTKYKKNMFVLIDESEDGLVVGKIKVILIHRDSAVHFFVEKYLALRLPNLGKTYCCVNQVNVLDYYHPQGVAKCF